MRWSTMPAQTLNLWRVCILCLSVGFPVPISKNYDDWLHRASFINSCFVGKQYILNSYGLRNVLSSVPCKIVSDVSVRIVLLKFRDKWDLIRMKFSFLIRFTHFDWFTSLFIASWRRYGSSSSSNKICNFV